MVSFNNDVNSAELSTVWSLLSFKISLLMVGQCERELSAIRENENPTIEPNMKKPMAMIIGLPCASGAFVFLAISVRTVLRSQVIDDGS